MSLADAWLALPEVALHDLATEARFTGDYDPHAAALEAARCRRVRTDPRGPWGPLPPGCSPPPSGTFVEWAGPDRVGWVGAGEPFRGPMETGRVSVTRVDHRTLRIGANQECTSDREFDLHLVSETRAWAVLCGARVELVRGESVEARRARWERAHVTALLTAADAHLPSLTGVGAWRIDGVEQDCRLYLLGCDPSRGVVVGCAPASGPWHEGWWTAVERAGGGWALRRGLDVAECWVHGWGGLPE